MQGGAYGVFAQFDDVSGMFSYLSYRDPNLLGTLESYDGAGGFLRTIELSQENITKAIIGVIGALDAYQLPDAKGWTSLVRHLTGTSDAYRQQRRDEVLATSLADFRAFADAVDYVKQNGLVVVLGSEQAVSGANAGLERPLRLTKVQ